MDRPGLERWGRIKDQAIEKLVAYPARRWPLHFLIRRTAQHAIDHGWEIEDRNPA